MDRNITTKPVDTYHEAIKAAAAALADCGYCRDDDPASVDSNTEWEVAQAMMAEYSLHDDEGSLCEFLTEPGGFRTMMTSLRFGAEIDFYSKAKKRAAMYAAHFIPEAWELLDSRSEIQRDREVDIAIKHRKENAA